MKKIAPIFLALFLLAVVCCLGSCSEQKQSGETNTYSWTLNTNNRTLTLTGKQPEDKPDLSPGPWLLEGMEKVEHIALKGKEPYFVSEDCWSRLPNLKTYSGSYNGASWIINLEKRTLTIDADGVVSNEMFPFVEEAWAHFADSVDRLVIGNGVTSIQQVVAVGKPADPRPILRQMGFETVALGKNLKSIEGLDTVAQQSYEVSGKNPTFFTYDGAVYFKADNIIAARPSEKASLTYHPDMPEQIAGMLGSFSWRLNFIDQTLTFEGSGAMPDPCNLVEQCIPYRDSISRIVFGDKISTITREQDERNILSLEADTCVLGKRMHHNMQLTRMAEKSYEVDPDNPYLSVYDGALYSKDYKKLVAFPAQKMEVEFPKNLKVIGQDSFINAQIPLVVVPWGVTIVEDNAFSHMGSYGAAVILPDTLELAGTRDESTEEWATVYLYSDENEVAKKAYPIVGEAYSSLVEQKKQQIGFTSVYDFYPGLR